MFLVDRLAADAEHGRNPLPTPSLLARIRDLKSFDGLKQGAERGDRAEPDLGITATRVGHYVSPISRQGDVVKIT
jgi:hypothetical protein